jgi:cysteine desulfurase
VEEARARVQRVVGSDGYDVTFVSGATEALCTVLRGYATSASCSRKKIITCATEHDAVLSTSRYLSSSMGVEVSTLAVDKRGNLDASDLRSALDGSTGALVVLMAANNEIGTMHRIREISELVHATGALFLCDTTQAFGKTHLSLREDGVDFATISSHKIHGLSGSGALVVRKELLDIFEPLIVGGGQERGRRGGTVNVPGIVGLGEACRLVLEHLPEDMERMGWLRDRLEDGIRSQFPDSWINGDQSSRLPNTSNIGFKGVDARTLIRDMHDIACSTRSACSSGNTGPSHVLKAIGLSDEDAYSCIRFSLGRFTTEEEIDYTINKVVTSVHKLRRNKSVRM